MSPFTEAHFAATLLECGPHVSTLQMFHTPDSDAYLNRCYSYFFKLFPRKVEYFDTKNVKHEWMVFWQEYLEWIGETS